MSEIQQTHTEQPSTAPEQARDEGLILFLGIGIIINLVLISLFVVWARKQWRKSEPRDDRAESAPAVHPRGEK